MSILRATGIKAAGPRRLPIRAPCRAFLCFIVLFSVPGLAANYRNLTLEQAFEVLENQGLTILYSSDLVKPWMRVREEPGTANPRKTLEAIVAPYDLGVSNGPNGSVMLVRVEPAPEPAKAGDITGVVVSASDGTPIVAAAVYLGGQTRSAVTDARGQFEFPAVPVGTYQLRLDDDRHQPPEIPVAQVRPGETTHVMVPVVDLLEPDLEEVVVNASQYGFVRVPTTSRSSFSAAELQVMPDIGDDPLRAIARLPGSTSGTWTAKSNVRGGETDETLVRFDGLRLFNPFHLKDFQSLFSTIDPSVVSGVDVYTGGFPVTFGDRMSSVIDIQPLAPASEPLREISLSFFNASVVAADSFNEGRSNWLVSGRRSNLDLILDVVDDNLGEPTYIDLHGRLGHRVNDSLDLSASFLIFDDDITLSDSDQEEEARADYRDEYLWLRADYQLNQDVLASFLISRTELDSDRTGRADQSGISEGVLRDERSFSINTVQTDWSWRLGEEMLLSFGGELRDMEGDYAYQDRVDFDVLFLTPGASLEPQRERDLSANPDGEQYGAYASLRLEPWDRLTADLGVRWDKETLSAENDDQFSPRVSLLYELTDRLQLRGSWGRFFQAQAINELQISDGVTEFFPAQRSDHFVASLEYQHDSGVDFRLEAYRKDYDDLRPRFENLLNTFVVLPEIKPDRIAIDPDEATAKGIEVAVAKSDDSPVNWWLHYTWSSVKDRFPSGRIRRSWDQTHAVDAGLSWRRGPWEFSLAGTYHTGWPTTAAELAATGPDIALVATGPRNGERLGFYRKMDARLARHWELNQAGEITVFLELNNVFNRSNDCCVEYEVEGLEPDEDGSTEDEVLLDLSTQDYLSFFPSLGFVWRF